jgi:hypothetical protein
LLSIFNFFFTTRKVVHAMVGDGLRVARLGDSGRRLMFCTEWFDNICCVNVEPFDPLAGVEPGDLHGTIVRLSKILRAHRELTAVALDKLRNADIEFRKMRSRHHALIEELRRHTSAKADLRHEAASRRYFDEGWALVEVQELLGHATLEQTRTYLSVPVSGLQNRMKASDDAARCNLVAKGTESGLPTVSNGVIVESKQVTVN